MRAWRIWCGSTVEALKRVQNLSRILGLGFSDLGLNGDLVLTYSRPSFAFERYGGFKTRASTATPTPRRRPDVPQRPW